MLSDNPEHYYPCMMYSDETGSSCLMGWYVREMLPHLDLGSEAFYNAVHDAPREFIEAFADALEFMENTHPQGAKFSKALGSIHVMTEGDVMTIFDDANIDGVEPGVHKNQYRMELAHETIRRYKGESA